MNMKTSAEPRSPWSMISPMMIPACAPSFKSESGWLILSRTRLMCLENETMYSTLTNSEG